MFRWAAARRAAAAGAFSFAPESPCFRNWSVRLPTAAAIGAPKFYGNGGLDDSLLHQRRHTAQQMIQYTFGLARSRNSADSYAQALLVLEQGISNLRAGDGEGSDDAVAMLLIAMSTLLHERGEINDAMEKLRRIHQLNHCSPCTRVAAWEGLVGLSLEAGQDDSSSVLADECLQELRNKGEENVPMSNALYLRAKAIRGLVDLVRGDLQSAEMNFGECEDCKSTEGKYRCGNLALSCGEFLHATGNFSLARDFYERALQISEENSAVESASSSAANMVPDEVSLGATCALGQLFMHSRDFQGAEDLLTKALNKAEGIFGSNHPKVGVILTCLAMMYGQKARIEHSSSLLIQEGLYRRAIGYLSAPPLTNEGARQDQRRKDIIALARGGYAEILAVQQSRKDEGEELMKLAESQWRNTRLSLSQALGTAEPAAPNAAAAAAAAAASAAVAVVDTRISRVL